MVLIMPTLEKILLDFDPREENLLPVLRETSRTFSFVSEKDARKIASYFNLPFSRVYETASFFDLLETKKTSPREGLVLSESKVYILG